MTSAADEPRGERLVARYKQNYGIAEEAVVTEEMILEHWELEKSLRKLLLDSAPENRWDVFEQAYGELYSKLAWLNDLVDGEGRDTAAYQLWQQVIGAPPQRIFEIGSGRGELITYLAECGFDCTATEITRERGEKWTDTVSGLSWTVSDGIHLDQFESLESYDVVISNQVIEHMHPADVPEHFRSVRAILRPKGRYLFCTPHAYGGPTDVSGVFERNELMTMHLKEYNYRELKQVAMEAGFCRVAAVLRLPLRFRRLMGLPPVTSRAYLAYLNLLEGVLGRFQSPSRRRWIAKRAKALLFATNMMVMAQK